VPRESPAPVHAHFVMRVNHVARAELVIENFSALLRDAHAKVFRLRGPVSVSNPNLVLTSARNFYLLKDHCAGFVRARRRSVPLALSALRPLRARSRPIHSPARSLRALRVHP